MLLMIARTSVFSSTALRGRASEPTRSGVFRTVADRFEAGRVAAGRIGVTALIVSPKVLVAARRFRQLGSSRWLEDLAREQDVRVLANFGDICLVPARPVQRHVDIRGCRSQVPCRDIPERVAGQDGDLSR